MSTIYEPTLCQQCRCHSAKFEHDRRTGGYETACGRCGRRESHRPEHDEEGTYSEYTHIVRKGAGVLWFRYAGDPRIYCHYLHTPAEALAAEQWLREGLSTGVVETGSCFLTRWNDQTQQVECVVGELLDFLAGKIVRMVGVPGDVERGGTSTPSPALR
jgi:hypothetical protein